MRVQARLFATLRTHLPEGASGNTLDVELPEEATLHDLLRQLGLPHDEVKVIFVNGRVRPCDWELESGDEIGFFPLVGGG